MDAASAQRIFTAAGVGSERIAVLCGSYDEYRQYITERTRFVLPPEPRLSLTAGRLHYLYVDSAEQAAGYEFSRHVVYGTFLQRPDASAILERVNAQERF